MNRRHVPTAAQGFGFLGLLMALAYAAGVVQARWQQIVEIAQRPGIPLWVAVFAGVSLALLVFGVVVARDALRRGAR